MNQELTVLLQALPVGRLRRKVRGRIDFVYDDEWRVGVDNFPLSLSMPLAAAEHGPDVVESFLWNLLPDNETVLARWGSQFGVSARNIFELLKHVGEDLAGAVQIVLPDRVNELSLAGPEEIEWISEEDVAARLRALREDAGAWRLPRDTGQFSLAGAQPKTALLEREGKWGVPRGRTPTTHILKPPAGEGGGFAENEHFCLRVARRLGLPTANSRVQRFDEEIAIVVERYDRVPIGGKIVRVHQEDLCQSLAVHPASKYENEGGPGVAEVVNLLRLHSGDPTEDVRTFLRALALNWLMGGTDAHAKNFSVLIGNAARVRLAPLYDMVSRAAYDPWHPYEHRLAMRIGNEYVVGRITPRHWEKLAERLDLPPAKVWEDVLSIADDLPRTLREVEEELGDEGLRDPVLRRIVGRASDLASREADVFRTLLDRAHSTSTSGKRSSAASRSSSFAKPASGS